MQSYLDTIGLNLSANTPIGEARQQVLSSLPWNPTPTTSVSYTASNRVLIVGGGEQVEEVTRALGERFACFAVDPADPAMAGLTPKGYLGRFSATVGAVDPADPDAADLGKRLGIANGLFDHIIDFSESPAIAAAIKPPGYHHAVEQERLALALAEIPEMIGEFEKPRFFDYDPNICAHGRSGISGCTRCLDACPTDAISSIGELIEVNPYLCQGGGGCTASCPSGAISYRYPQVEEQVEFLRQMIRDLRQVNGQRGISLLIYDNEHGAEQVSAVDELLPEHLLPLAVEELASAGLELLASVFAYGATAVYLLMPETLAAQSRASLERDVALLQGVFDELQLDQFRLQSVVAIEDVLKESEDTSSYPEVATYAGIGGKRSLIRSAFEFFHQQSVSDSKTIGLPAESIFGEVELAVDACTLCMGCVSVCPGKALEAGGESPALRFIEANCLQCGICTRACPESALGLVPRFLFDITEANRSRTLKEEEPFRCIKCNKPFATHAMIERMTEKLTGHWMFETAEAMNRLRMCEDCRVADMFDQNA